MGGIFQPLVLVHLPRRTMKAVLCFVSAVMVTLAQGVPLQQETLITPGLLKSLNKCTSEGGLVGVMNCAASRVLKSLEIAETLPNIELIAGVNLTLNANSTLRKAKNLGSLPENPTEKASVLLDRVLGSTANFLSSRSLKIQIPATSPETLARSFEEGRAKMKKMMGPLIMGLGAKMIALVPIVLGAMGLLVTKALVVGKIALVLSAILFAQNFFSGRRIVPFGSGSLTPAYGVPSTSYGVGSNTVGWGYSGQQYPYQRSIIEEVTEKKR